MLDKRSLLLCNIIHYINYTVHRSISNSESPNRGICNIFFFSIFSKFLPFFIEIIFWIFTKNDYKDIQTPLTYDRTRSIIYIFSRFLFFWIFSKLFFSKLFFETFFRNFCSKLFFETFFSKFFFETFCSKLLFETFLRNFFFEIFFRNFFSKLLFETFFSKLFFETFSKIFFFFDFSKRFQKIFFFVFCKPVKNHGIYVNPQSRG